MALSGCLTELSMPADSGAGDELSLLFDQAVVADDTPAIVCARVVATEAPALALSAWHGCIGETMFEQLQASILLEVSDDEVESETYIGWASRGNLLHL